MPLNTLILMVGLPRSGKTTQARDLSRWHNAPIVNPDSIRLAAHGQRFSPPAEPLVWWVAKVMARALFLAGHQRIIIDATNITRKRRDEWHDPAWDAVFYVVDTPAEECIRRAQAAGDTEIIPVIKRMAAAFEPLGPDERPFDA